MNGVLDRQLHSLHGSDPYMEMIRDGKVVKLLGPDISLPLSWKAIHKVLAKEVWAPSSAGLLVSWVSISYRDTDIVILQSASGKDKDYVVCQYH